MSDPLTIKLLTQIAQATCCAASGITPIADIVCRSQGATTGWVSPDPGSDTNSVTLVHPTTSLEMENFSETLWLAFVLPGANHNTLLLVPPGGSKVLAFSGVALPAGAVIEWYFVTSPDDQVPVSPESAEYIQYTFLSQV